MSDAFLMWDLEPVPLRIFLCWNPAYKMGSDLSERLYEWLGGYDRSLHKAGLGIPVHPWVSDNPDQTPPPLPIDSQALTIFIPIIDAEFIGRANWRDWCVAQSQRHGHHAVGSP